MRPRLVIKLSRFGPELLLCLTLYTLYSSLHTVQQCTQCTYCTLYSSVQYFTACHCTVNIVALKCTLLHCILPVWLTDMAVQYSILHCTLLHFTSPHCNTVHFNKVYCTVIYCTVIYCTGQYCIEPEPPPYGVDQFST